MCSWGLAWFVVFGQHMLFFAIQEVLRQVVSTAERPLSGHAQSQGGTLQEALPLPALVAPALAAANQDQAYLRWKAVIHCLPGNNDAAAHAPDFTAARWLYNQMMYKDHSFAIASPDGEPIDNLLDQMMIHSSVQPLLPPVFYVPV